MFTIIYIELITIDESYYFTWFLYNLHYIIILHLHYIHHFVYLGIPTACCVCLGKGFNREKNIELFDLRILYLVPIQLK